MSKFNISLQIFFSRNSSESKTHCIAMRKQQLQRTWILNKKTDFKNVENKKLNKRLSLLFIRDLSLSLKSAMINEIANNQIIDEFIQTIRINHMIKWNHKYRNWSIKSEARLTSSMYECRVVKHTQNLLNFNFFNSFEIVLRKINITKIRTKWFRTIETWIQSISLLFSIRRVTIATMISYWFIKIKIDQLLNSFIRQTWFETTSDFDKNLNAIAYFNITNFNSFDNFSIIRFVKKKQINWFKKIN